MKKTYLLLAAVVLLFSLAGCGETAERTEEKPEPPILTEKVPEQVTVPEQVIQEESSAEKPMEKTDGYLLPTDTEILFSELEALSDRELMLARNEIFARHGYVFRDEELKAYFAGKSWYTPDASYDPTAEGALTETEKWNLENITFLEKRRSRAPSRETGTVTPDPEGRFSVTIPENWAGKYVTVSEKAEDGTVWMRFYSALNYPTLYGGHVFSLILTEGDYSDFPSFRLLGELTADGVPYHLVAIYPTDVQFDMEKEESMAEYHLLSESAETVINSVTAAGTAVFTPAA